MPIVRRKGAMDWDRPNYDAKSKYLTLVLHFGGTFMDQPNTLYVGGQKLAYDWVKVDEVSMRDLDKWSTEAGVKGQKKISLRMPDYNFKLCIGDNELRKWASKFLVLGREMHIYVELLVVEVRDEDDPDYESFEGSDYAIGNEIISSDDDDEIFDREVEVYNDRGVDPGNDEGDMSLGHNESEKSGESKVWGVIEVMSEREVRGKGKGKVVTSDSSESECEIDRENDVVAGDAHDFDEHRVSDEDNDEASFPIFNPKTTFNPDFCIGQVFSSKMEFRTAAQSDAIKHRRNIHFPKNDTRRIYAKCCDPKCKWKIHTLKRKNEQSFQIREFNPKHSCAPSSKVKSLTSSWLSKKFLQRFKADPNKEVSIFMADACYDTRCEVSRQQAHRAKSLALLKINGDPDAQYAKLWSYCEEIRKTNPGSTILIGTTVENGVTIFSSAYVCFEAMKKGFLAGCRPIIGVDGCHLKSKHGGVLLSAVGVDGNNNLYPIAYAIVDKENGQNWEWFFSILKSDLNLNTDGITFMSDKQKGLIQALESVFPGVDHRFCVRHMHNNLKNAGYTGLAYKQAVWNAACSTTEGEFKRRMKELKDLNEGAWEWFTDKPGAQWSKAFFSEKSKCDMLLNNVCESFNSAILDARGKAIITMLEWIREYLMKRLQKNRDRAKKWEGRLCPRISTILDKNMEQVADCIPLKSNDIYYQVISFDGGQYSVNLQQRVCTCRLWQLTGIPCKHAICAILKQKLDPLDFVDECYSVETYLKVYDHPIFPISCEELWGETVYIPPLPPTFGSRARRGRRVTKRRLGADETREAGKAAKAAKKKAKDGERMKRQQKTLCCRTCGEQGHNTTTCKMKKIEGEERGSATGTLEGKRNSSKGKEAPQ